MPANLTPEYERAELRYRQATSDEERLAALQAMLSAIPKHKGTEKMQADIKSRISLLRREEQKALHSKGPDPFHIPRSGAGQVVLVGPPNTGKSSLVAATTHAAVKVADYPFTTVVPQPGMWEKDDVQIELVDTPPFTAEHVPTGLMGTIRNADLVCAVIEASEAALDQAELVLGILRARGLTLCSRPRNQLPTGDPSLRAGLIVATKADVTPPGTIEAVRELYAGGEGTILEKSKPGQVNTQHSGDGLEVIGVSVRTGQGLDDWFKRLWELLAMIRVYSKEPGRPPDLHKPFVVPAGATVADLAGQIHRDLPERMKFARLWGHSRFEGQQVHKTEPLRDRDVVEIHE
jgi:uncharacterized protein